MEEMRAGTYGTRPRGQYIKVFLTPEEMAEIQEKAKMSGLSKSAFLRALALNQKVRSVLDLHAVADLGKVNGDLGRVAGLLKLWLLEKRGEGASPNAVELMMNDFRSIQNKMLDLMHKAVHGPR